MMNLKKINGTSALMCMCLCMCRCMPGFSMILCVMCVYYVRAGTCYENGCGTGSLLPNVQKVDKLPALVIFVNF